MIDLPDKAIEATARAMYEQRPQASDPVHWETPWDEVPEKWKAGQARAAISVLTAALPAIEAALREQVAEEILENTNPPEGDKPPKWLSGFAMGVIRAARIAREGVRE